MSYKQHYFEEVETNERLSRQLCVQAKKIEYLEDCLVARMILAKAVALRIQTVRLRKCLN